MTAGWIDTVRSEEALEFGLGETAIKKGEDGKYHLKYLTWFRKTASGQICVHSE
ncbi:MAG: hypothetical protein AAF585_11100 [Verrucomicrobiota bacterium]